MKKLIFIYAILCVPLLAFSQSNNLQKQEKYPFKASEFEVKPLNSPVKEPIARFGLKLPAGFQIDEVKIKLLNTRELKKEDKQFEKVQIINNVLEIPVSKLPPGFYRLFVQIKDKKNQKQQLYQKNFHNFVRFVIDESMEVPLPASKVNDSTLGGVDVDNNGIRDDIQRFINETYHSKPSTKLALKQFAEAYQQKMVNSIDKQTTIENGARESEALICLAWINGSSSRFVNEIEPMQLNTKLRIQKSLQLREWFKGEGFPQSVIDMQKNGGDYSPLCSFDEATKGQ